MPVVKQESIGLPLSSRDGGGVTWLEDLCGNRQDGWRDN